VRSQERRRQGAFVTERPEARHARPEKRRAAGRGCRRVRCPRGCLVAELAPVGALQTVLARQVAIAAWRLARADRIEVELFEQRRWDNGSVGVALIRDGNGTRSFETLMRYRGAALAELMRALRTLKALQAEQALQAEAAAELPVPPLASVQARRSAARLPVDRRLEPNKPEPGAERRLEYVLPDPPVTDRTLHEPAPPWLPNEPEGRPVSRVERRPEPQMEYVPPDPPAINRTLHEPAAPRLPNEPENGSDLHESGRPGDRGEPSRKPRGRDSIA
jgi:hypothetical protein